MKRRINLRDIAATLVAEFPSISSLWLFGSRRHRTRSLRSDIDLLVCAEDHIRPADLRVSTYRTCPALDLFVVEGGKATSCMNESFVRAESFDALRGRLDAVCIWSRNTAEVQNDAPFEQEILDEVTYVATSLDGGEPRVRPWSRPIQALLREIEAEGLPVAPYVGDSVDQVGRFLLELANRVISTCEQMAERKTKASWKPALTSEYDLQNAFYLVVKPWLPELEREAVTIRFDNQEKIADFSILHSRIVIEMKFVDDANSKAAVGKTLDGLGNFYTRNANVVLLLFIIGAKKSGDVDGPKWESTFSSRRGQQTILTRVIPLRD